jgi:5'-AMP-activated protein kinase catalytic alpha subunit
MFFEMRIPSINFSVKLGKNLETNEFVAIKILNRKKIEMNNMNRQVKKEILIMKTLNHPNVVAVKDSFSNSTEVFIVLEYAGGGELYHRIEQEGPFSEEKARFYFKQLVEGIEYCHNNEICHRDLKPEVFFLIKFEFIYCLY